MWDKIFQKAIEGSEELAFWPVLGVFYLYFTWGHEYLTWVFLLSLFTGIATYVFLEKSREAISKVKEETDRIHSGMSGEEAVAESYNLGFELLYRRPVTTLLTICNAILAIVIFIFLALHLWPPRDGVEGVIGLYGLAIFSAPIMYYGIRYYKLGMRLR